MVTLFFATIVEISRLSQKVIYKVGELDDGCTLATIYHVSNQYMYTYVRSYRHSTVESKILI